MILDNQLFRSVVTALRGEVRTGDKRRTPRVGLTAELTLTLLTEGRLGKNISVRVRDLSHSGIGFLHRKFMKEGVRLVLELPVFEAAPRFILCEVKHSRPVASGIFRIGAIFIDQDYARPEDCAAGAPAASEPETGARDRIRRAILD